MFISEIPNVQYIIRQDQYITQTKFTQCQNIYLRDPNISPFGFNHIVYFHNAAEF